MCSREGFRLISCKQENSGVVMGCCSGVSKSSVDSRFQRMNTKLEVANRRTAAQLAVECNLSFVEMVADQKDSHRQEI